MFEPQFIGNKILFFLQEKILLTMSADKKETNSLLNPNAACFRPFVQFESQQSPKLGASNSFQSTGYVPLLQQQMRTAIASLYDYATQKLSTHYAVKYIKFETYELTASAIVVLNQQNKSQSNQSCCVCII